ncbi:MAG: FAD-dependent oxidoreductase [Candidatus Nealsonbacteria bacterium]|nr:FAD-dependent oxidoreductase [Candidatus Nealsonbacteria bacterium]
MKIAIIGAGIVGLYLSLNLSRKGHKVVVFEKKAKIGKSACSGLFSERILQFIPEAESLTQNKIKSVLIHFPGKTLKIEFSKPFLVMNHAQLDMLVADLAKKAGAEIKLNYNWSSNNEFDRVIGCDGAQSFIRKSLKEKEPKYRLGIIGFTAQKDGSDYVETWPVKNGFIWRIPRGDETEYGIIAESREAKKLFDDFLKKNNIFLSNITSALIPQGLIIPKNNNITLCGDAAGLTKPWSGGGVIFGLIAAQILLATFSDFLKYRQNSIRYFYSRMFFYKIITKIVYFLGFNFPWILPKNIKIEGDFLL